MKTTDRRCSALKLAAGPLLALICAPISHALAQNIYVADQSGAYMIVKFDAGGNESTFVPINWGGSSWDQPSGVALGGNGALYVAYTGGGTNFIKTFDANGNGTVFTGLGASTGAQGIVFDGHGNLYVADFTNGTIEKYSSSGTDLGTFGNVAMQSPDALAFDSHGNLYCSDLFGEKIYKFNAGGQGTVFASGDYYRGLAFDGKDNLYVGVGWSIDKFDKNGASLGTLALRSGEFAAEGMEFDSSGNLFMSDYLHGTICEFDPQGNESTFGAMAGASDLEWLALQPAPAPQLAIAPSPGNKFVLNWPATAANYILQSSTNLVVSNWTDNVVSPFIANGQCWLTNPVSGNKSVFYRLRKP